MPALFAPTGKRFLFVACAAVLGFCLPQEVPLQYFPLNEPGDDILYLEITCASNQAGHVQIYYDTTRGINELDSINLPIAPTVHAYTSIFPLPDAPIVGLRLDPVANGGELNLSRFRIIDRRGAEIRRLSRDMFFPVHQIAAIAPTLNGWSITSTPGADDPRAGIKLESPVIPAGYNRRNLQRCLLSCGYLAVMLSLLLLAVLFIGQRPRGRRAWLASGGFTLAIACLFSLVGNRGLIRDALHDARFVAPRPTPGLRLEFDLVTSRPATARLVPDTGQGYREAGGVSRDYETHAGLQVLRFPLPGKTLRALRFDPRDREGRLEIRGIRIVDAGQRTRAVLPFDSLVPGPEIVRLDRTADSLIIETKSGATDPGLDFTPSAIARINGAIAANGRF